MIKNFLNKNVGFTLVELMVAISIIGILSAIVYANFDGARKAARDDIRKTDLKNLQLAIELYKAQNGQYPDRCASAGLMSGPVSGEAKCTNANDDYIIGLVPDYIGELPVDPTASKNIGTVGYFYWVSADNMEYKMMANSSVEAKFVTSYADEFARCPAPSGTAWCPSGRPQFNNYAVYNGPNAQGI